jgi:2-polyprenyl-3-methyl-5-hydroxy-6-metoxy-1,4-benzoquinol methylase
MIPFKSSWNLDGLRSRHRGYSGARPDVLKMVNGSPRKVLDVGCGAGVLGQALAASIAGCRVIGVEPDKALATAAAKNMHAVVSGRIDEDLTQERIAALGPYDLIVCADVLEHLAEPGLILSRLVGMLSREGTLITSLPNIRHISTFFSLGVLGTWPARDRGIHDRTHLRFFARRDILRLGADAGLSPIKESRNLRLLEAHAWTMIPAKLLDFWPFRAFFTFQYLHCWKRLDGS